MVMRFIQAVRNRKTLLWLQKSGFKNPEFKVEIKFTPHFSYDDWDAGVFEFFNYFYSF